jgi:hypothetical protein
VGDSETLKPNFNMLKFDEPVKSQNPDGFEKSSSSRRANLSGVRLTLCTPQRLRDAAQRRDWTFCGTVKI